MCWRSVKKRRVDLLLLTDRGQHCIARRLVGNLEKIELISVRTKVILHTYLFIFGNLFPTGGVVYICTYAKMKHLSKITPWLSKTHSLKQNKRMAKNNTLNYSEVAFYEPWSKSCWKCTRSWNTQFGADTLQNWDSFSSLLTRSGPKSPSRGAEVSLRDTEITWLQWLPQTFVQQNIKLRVPSFYFYFHYFFSMT